MRVKVEIEASDGSTTAIFDESVSEEWQLSQLADILKIAYALEKMLSDYVKNTPEEDKNERSNCL